MEKFQSSLVLIFVIAMSCASKEPSGSLSSTAFQVYADSVVQGKFRAVALSDHEIVSTYQSPANQFQSPRIDFKFAINSKDNEMVPGIDHHFNCLSASCESPLIAFGTQLNDTSPIPANTYLQPNTSFKIRLDLRKVFKAFDEQGYFETYKGEKIYKADFKSVHVAGAKAPLTWDFDNLGNHADLELTDANGDHIYEVTLLFNAHDADKKSEGRWTLQKDISAYPQYKSPSALQNAIYNLSLEEMVRAVEPDSTFRTGKEWAGVWTRDISYSIILSMAILQPEVAKHSLKRKVTHGVIIQDTGTGGAYPVSTDRMVWAIAAWELYKVTGDRDWLQQSYAVIKKSIEDDLQNAIDPVTGLIKGESSFLDWREQTYPSWMQPADIYESECLGTNMVHYGANKVLAAMAELLGDTLAEDKHSAVASKISEGINRNLWIGDKGYYGQFLYGRNFKMRSPRSEALGAALAVLFDVADDAQIKSVIEKTPVTEFGIPCLYPQIPNIPPYHNNATWPFVQAYWTMACAKAENESALVRSLEAIIRPSALFLTNKENFVSETGDFVGTQINSDNMLWSLSGNIAMVYKVLFGIQYESDHLLFQPFVPESFKGKRTLSNLKYRDATLNIVMEGHGRLKQILLDGMELPQSFVPASIQGDHSVTIILDNKSSGGKSEICPNLVSPDTPHVTLKDSQLHWESVEGAVAYQIFKNGELLTTTTNGSFQVTDQAYGEYQVVALSADSVSSFASEPAVVSNNVITVEAESHAKLSSRNSQGFSGNGFAQISARENRKLNFDVQIREEGVYALDFIYANGNGPVNTENKCAIRALYLDGKFLSTMVFPQRGHNEWSDWGYSNSTMVKLTTGSHQITLQFDEVNNNMHGDINEAAIDLLRLQKVKDR